EGGMEILCRSASPPVKERRRSKALAELGIAGLLSAPSWRTRDVSALVLPLILVALLASPAGAGPRGCSATAVAAFGTCLGRAGRALTACALRGGERCTQDARVVRASDGLRRKVLARCSEAAIRDVGFPPPAEPPAVAARLASECLGNAATLAGRGMDD